MLLLAILSCAAPVAMAAAANANVRFDGNAKTVPDNCTLPAANVYNCTAFPLTSDTDDMTIANGVTVNIRVSSTFTYNQSLTMSGTAQLNVTGDLDIGGVNAPNLKITGGSLIASGKFTVGTVNQTLTANITAGSIAMGSGSTLKITGNVLASDAIDIASNFTLSGTLTGGTIVTSAGVVLGGNVKATTAFTLASGSTVNGTVDAPVTRLLAAGSVVNGAITAKTSLFVGASNTVNGDVTTGALATEASTATINGNATVDSADLEWQGRVLKTIYCTGGTRAGQCDCVTNNSGYPGTTTEGPHCASAKVTPPPLHHLQIAHDGTASACSPQPVTVTACANAACTSLFTGGVTGTLSPGGAKFSIDTTGRAAPSTVTMNRPGTVTLAVADASVAPTAAAGCTNTATNTASCDMQFDGGVGMTLDFPDHVSDTATDGVLKTIAYDPANQNCGPGFVSVTKAVTFACSYANPASGTLPVRLSADGGATFVALNSGTTASCSAAGRSLSIPFSATGTASVKMQYADVGRMRIDASTSNGSKTVTTYDPVVVSPASYQFTAYPAIVIAGDTFSVSVQALNASGNVTQNFGRETADGASLAETLSFGASTPCVNSVAVPQEALVTVDKTTLAAGVVTATVRYPEAGKFNIAARQKNPYYLAGTVSNTAWATPGAQTNCGMTRAYPAYFEVRTGVNRDQAWYYSGQPIDITVTAKNALGTTTQRYDDAYKTSFAVQVSILDPAVSPATPVGVQNAAAGTGTIAATAFKQGVATIVTAASKPPASNPNQAVVPTSPAVTYTFKTIPTVPTTLTLRAVETGTTVNTVSSANGAKYNPPIAAEARPEIRSGRIVVGSVAGGAKMTLKLPVVAQYFDKTRNWVRNAEENLKIPAGAIVIRREAALAAPSNVSAPCCDLQLVQGLGTVDLKPAGGTGSAFVIFNLGANTAAAADAACVPARMAPLPDPMPNSVGAGAPWLRAPNGVCGVDNPAADPVGRAMFGTTVPERRRSMHVREVFN
jgi:MSHA biogenesis protein MshQ